MVSPVLLGSDPKCPDRTTGPTLGTAPCSSLATEDDDPVPGTHLQLLGRFQVRRDGEEIAPAAFGGRKVRALLRVLAVRCPDLVPHEALADALWPDRLPADPAGNLGVLVN